MDSKLLKKYLEFLLKFQERNNHKSFHREINNLFKLNLLNANFNLDDINKNKFEITEAPVRTSTMSQLKNL